MSTMRSYDSNGYLDKYSTVKNSPSKKSPLKVQHVSSRQIVEGAGTQFRSPSKSPAQSRSSLRDDINNLQPTSFDFSKSESSEEESRTTYSDSESISSDSSHEDNASIISSISKQFFSFKANSTPQDDEDDNASVFSRVSAALSTAFQCKPPEPPEPTIDTIINDIRDDKEDFFVAFEADSARSDLMDDSDSESKETDGDEYTSSARSYSSADDDENETDNSSDCNLREEEISSSTSYCRSLQCRKNWEDGADSVEVDFDSNPTKLYVAIDTKQWEDASACLRDSPTEAKIWVYRQDALTDQLTWLFLPLHAVCFSGAPSQLVKDLIEAYPEAVRSQANDGKLPLHIACETGASADILKLLLDAFPASLYVTDCDGNMPLQLALLSQKGLARTAALQVLTDYATGKETNEVEINDIIPSNISDSEKLSFIDDTEFKDPSQKRKFRVRKSVSGLVRKVSFFRKRQRNMQKEISQDLESQFVNKCVVD